MTIVRRCNRPFATNDHMVQNPPYWRASSLLFPHWDVKTKRLQPVKLDWPLFLSPPAGIIMSLPSSMADFVPCDRLLQKAYCNLSVKTLLNLDLSHVNQVANQLIYTAQFSALPLCKTCETHQ